MRGRADPRARHDFTSTGSFLYLPRSTRNPRPLLNKHSILRQGALMCVCVSGGAQRLGAGSRGRQPVGTFLSACVSGRIRFPKARAPRPHLPPLAPLLRARVRSPVTGATSSRGTPRGARPAPTCDHGGSPGPFRNRPDPRGCCTEYGGREAGGSGARAARGAGPGASTCARCGEGPAAGLGRAPPRTRRAGLGGRATNGGGGALESARTQEELGVEKLDGRGPERIWR